MNFDRILVSIGRLGEGWNITNLIPVHDTESNILPISIILYYDVLKRKEKKKNWNDFYTET